MLTKTFVNAYKQAFKVTTVGTLLHNQLKSVSFLIIAKVLINKGLSEVFVNLFIAIKCN
jgi:hypothetical protein